jgi:ABC-2 type transport system ATP-binding protein
MEDEIVLRACRISRSFEGITAVQDLSIEVRKGELFGIVGPDGAGKTTTIRILSGILTPSSGEAFVGPFSVLKEPERIKEIIGYMPQRFGLYEDLSVLENMEFYAELYGVPRQTKKERVESLLEFAGLSAFKRRLARDLSGGMKQKLGLACCLIHRPKVLLLDEPTCGVDPLSRAELWRRLADLLKEGVTILVSTPYIDEAERCTRVGLMHKGRFLLVEEPEKMKAIIDLPVLEVVCEDGRRVVQEVGWMEGIWEATVYGDRVHLTLASSELREVVASRLDRAGIRPNAMRFVRPSLEDVFISLARS